MASVNIVAHAFRETGSRATYGAFDTVARAFNNANVEKSHITDTLGDAENDVSFVSTVQGLVVN